MGLWQRIVLGVGLGAVLGTAGCQGVAEPISADDDITEVGDSEGDAGAADGWEPVPDDGSGAGESGGDEPPVPTEPFCGDGHVDAGELCDDGNDNEYDGCLSDCMPVAILEPPEGEWRYYSIAGTQCIDGSPAGFAVNRVTDSPNVMIYLEGGGACFNDACDFTAYSAPFVAPSKGIFERSGDNPVGDWTMVYVPYCSGDIYAGSADRKLGGKERHFHGWDNMHRYLQHLVPSFPDAEMVLLSGSSAGGFGAALNAGRVADAFGDDVEVLVIDDSGPPMSDAVMPPCLQDIFRDVWGLDHTILADCPDCDEDDFAVDLLAHQTATHDNLRFGLMTTMGDLVIRGYMGFGWGNLQYDNCGGLPLPVPLLAFHDDLVGFRAVHEEDASTFYRFGFDHTVLHSGFFSAKADGMTAARWVSQLIDGATLHVGP